VVYAAPPMINKPVSEPQKTASESALVAAAAKPTENITTMIETVATTGIASAVSTTPGTVASGIELNIPVEKIEAEKKSTVVSVSQPLSIAAAAKVEPREAPSSSAQANSAKKDKKEKKRKFVRMAAGTVWEDQTLGEWDLGELLVFSCSICSVGRIFRLCSKY